MPLTLEERRARAAVRLGKEADRLAAQEAAAVERLAAHGDAVFDRSVMASWPLVVFKNSGTDE